MKSYLIADDGAYRGPLRAGVCCLCDALNATQRLFIHLKAENISSADN